MLPSRTDIIDSDEECTAKRFSSLRRTKNPSPPCGLPPPGCSGGRSSCPATQAKSPNERSAPKFHVSETPSTCTHSACFGDMTGS